MVSLPQNILVCFRYPSDNEDMKSKEQVRHNLV